MKISAAPSQVQKSLSMDETNKAMELLQQVAATAEQANYYFETAEEKLPLNEITKTKDLMADPNIIKYQEKLEKQNQSLNNNSVPHSSHRNMVNAEASTETWFKIE